MASYTSTTTGNWSSTATWGGSGPPGSGDTATIATGTTVTVNDARTCTSWTQQGTGVLAISGTGSLTATGDTLEEGHASDTAPKITVAAGGQLLWAPGTGVTITHKSGGTYYNYCGLQARGTTGARCTVGKATGSAGTLLWRSDYIYLRGGVLDCEFTDLDGWGDASSDAASLDVRYQGFIRLHDCRLRTGGRWSFTLRDLDTYGGSLDLVDSTWSGTLATNSLQIISLGSENAAPASLVRCDLDRGFAPTWGGGSVGTLTLTDCLFRGQVVGGWPSANVVSSGHLCFQTAAVAAPGMYTQAGTHTDLYHLADFTDSPGTGNPHFWNLTATGETSVLDRCCFDYIGDAGADIGDALDLTSGTATVRRSLILPAVSSSAIPAGAVWWLGASGTLSLDHCTIYSPTNWGSGLLFPHTATMAAGKVPFVKSNLFWSDQTASAGIISDETTVGDYQAVDALTPAGCTTNAFVGMASSSTNLVAGSSTSLNGLVKLRLSVAPTGNLTVAASPGAQFVDPTRNFLAWARTVRSHSGTDAVVRAAGLADIAADRTLTRTSLLPWVLAGFRPQNATLNGATYSGDPLTTDAAGNALGGTIGAMAYLAATGPLVAGTASFVHSGPGGISVLAPAPTGGTGTGPTYQWERNANGGSYSDLAGATALALDDTTAMTEGVLYGYRCKQARGTDTVTTNVVTAQVYPGGSIGVAGIVLIGVG